MNEDREIAEFRRQIEAIERGEWPKWRWLTKLKNLISATVPRHPYDPDGDGEGIWYKPFENSSGYCWRAPTILEADRCPSEECLFGREWIQCKKRRGHKGVHRNSETWGWDVGDERA